MYSSVNSTLEGKINTSVSIAAGQCMSRRQVTAASLLDRILQNIINPVTVRKPPHLKGPNPLTSTIINHVSSWNINESIQLLADYRYPLPTSAYASLFHLSASSLHTQKVLSHILAFNPSPPAFLLNRAIECYGRCGSLEDARRVFDGMKKRDGGTWNALISAYSQMGISEEVFSLFHRMNSMGIRATCVTFTGVLRSCVDALEIGLVMQVHGLLLRFGLCCSNVVLGTSLVDCYGKCLLMCEARKMFEDIIDPNVVSWNVIVRRYLEAGSMEDVIFMFFRMINEGVAGPLCFTFSNALKACGDILCHREGQQIHCFIIKNEFDGNDVIGSCLIEMYGKCGLVDDARCVFYHYGSLNLNVVGWTSMISQYIANGRIDCAEKLFSDMPVRNVVSWNAMLGGYIQSSRWEDALDFILWMQRETMGIDHVTLNLILNVCAGVLDLERGKQAHAFAYRHGMFLIGTVGNSILDMYGKCGSLKAVDICFNQIASNRDRVSWNTLIRSFTCHKRSELALIAFSEMQQEVTPNDFTLSVALAACANIFALHCGKQIHGYMLRNGHGKDLVSTAALVDMYSKCRCLNYAARVFEGADSRDIILWNSMILGCAYNGFNRDALDLFGEMEKDRIKADNVTFSGILLACMNEGFVELGLQYFNSMSEKYGVIPRIEHYDCMIDLLGRHGFLDVLKDFVESMPFEPTISMWTRISDYCREHGYSSFSKTPSTEFDLGDLKIPH